jgi:DNA processing protein
MSYIFDLALSLIPNIGVKTHKKLISMFGSSDVLMSSKASDLKKILQSYPKIAQRILEHREKVLEKAHLEHEYIQKNNIHILHYQQDQYPTRLKNIDDAPILLFKRGKGTLNHTKVIGIVGTRKPTNYGLRQCEKIIEGLSHHKDLAIVSGLAYGIDIQSHKKSLEYNIPTVGVLGNGLGNIYPASHQEIAHEMIENGAVLTEFISTEKPNPHNFPKRNRIVAGMIDGLVVIESARTGGSLITANIANSYHKEVMALPGMVHEKYSSGCHQLIKTHMATLIENAQDIERCLHWEKGDLKPAKQSALLFPFTAGEQKIIDVLKDFTPMHIDYIAETTELKMNELSTLLLQLEFNFVVVSLPGKMYALKK